MSAEKPLLFITPGDPMGIGPEVVVKALRSPEIRALGRFVCIGAKKGFQLLHEPITEIDESSLSTVPKDSDKIFLLPSPTEVPNSLKLKKPCLEGYQSGWSVKKAVQLILAKKGAALITGPIHKERLQKGGFLYDGHTSLLKKLGKSKSVTMMLANNQLRITLVTTHIALNDVSKSLTRTRVRTTILNTAEHLKSWWGIPKPRIAIAALNPHAGEAGLFGKEEIRVLTPEIKEMNKKYSSRFEVSGPFPADTLFLQRTKFDAVVCMYHDQGLIPVKLLDFPRTVNISLGLPFIRTSVDHGVGFDIAHKNVADPTSMESAIQLASEISHRLQNKKGTSK